MYFSGAYDQQGAAPPATGAPAAGYVLLAGEGGSPPVKLSQQDAQMIQQHTGLPPDQLEDNDLNQAMQELNIHSLPLTPQDQSALGIQPSSTVIVHRHPSAPPPPSNPQATIEQQLQSLHEMVDKRLITEDDYNAKKKQMLGI